MLTDNQRETIIDLWHRIASAQHTRVEIPAHVSLALPHKGDRLTREEIADTVDGEYDILPEGVVSLSVAAAGYSCGQYDSDRWKHNVNVLVHHYHPIVQRRTDRLGTESAVMLLGDLPQFDIYSGGRPDIDAAIEILREIARDVESLESYPVLAEQDLEETQSEIRDETWHKHERRGLTGSAINVLEDILDESGYMVEDAWEWMRHYGITENDFRDAYYRHAEIDYGADDAQVRNKEFAVQAAFRELMNIDL